uniref:Uncharacterized protein n=1 Tax=Arundo donax TaxID=35708 RepID=A0A0A9FJM6_ARUDO
MGGYSHPPSIHKVEPGKPLLNLPRELRRLSDRLSPGFYQWTSTNLLKPTRDSPPDSTYSSAQGFYRWIASNHQTFT